MRSRVRTGAISVVLALGALAVLPSGSQAEVSSAGSVTPVRTIGEVQLRQLASAQAIVGLPLEDARTKVRQTENELRVLALQKAMDDRDLAGVRLAVEELAGEAEAIAAATVQNAVTSYRQTDLDQSLFEVTDLNEGLRANALGDAALVADTDVFEDFRNTNKDLVLANGNLEAEIAENEAIQARVDALQERLEAEQSWLLVLEEQNLHDRARTESAQTSIWAQSLGTKQGFYLRTCPVDGPHEFIDSWGFPRSGGRRHKGVDILADIGVPIVAPVDGTVEFRSNRVGGRSFHFWDENGNYFYGTHLSGYGDTQGEVRAGQLIGYVGDDGNAAGIPHLHFEIHPGGRGNAINPFLDTATVCSGASYD
ncbi:MAG: M23 family metallopeptidase [Actinomycetota bacterium]